MFKDYSKAYAQSLLKKSSQTKKSVEVNHKKLLEMGFSTSHLTELRVQIRHMAQKEFRKNLRKSFLI